MTCRVQKATGRSLECFFFFAMPWESLKSFKQGNDVLDSSCCFMDDKGREQLGFELLKAEKVHDVAPGMHG